MDRGRWVVVIVVLSLLGAACGDVSGTSTSSAETSSAETSTTETSSEDGSGDRLGDFPAAPDDDWLLGVDYVGTALLSLVDGSSLDPSEVTVHFLAPDHIGFAAGGCSLGSGPFVVDDGRITDADLVSPAIACTPTNDAVFDAVAMLIGNEPEIRADGRRLLLLGDRHRLELEAEGPGLVSLIADHERFIGTDTTVASLEPTAIELTSDVYFAWKVSLPTCDLHGTLPTDADPPSFVIGSAASDQVCEHSPTRDAAALSYFTEGVSIEREGDVIELTNAQGALRFRLTTADNAPQEKEEVTPPPRVVPPLPDRTLPAEAGRRSDPWHASRAGWSDPGGVDVPIPEDWRAGDPSRPIVSAAGRGELTVTTVGSDGLAFIPDDLDGRLRIIEGPVEVEVKLYRRDGDQVVENGDTITVHQYRLGSDDPDEWLRRVVRVLERNGGATVATVSWPEFPADSEFADPEDSINLTLTGLDPIDLLDDIRFFEEPRS